jgi:Kef-type K+ transport system membrane component KefB
VENVWLIAALWIALALAASLLSVWLTISVALTEIVVGAIAGNIIHLQLTDWVNWLAGFGAILLTFLAGVEIDAAVIKRNFWSVMAIGAMGFAAPYLGVLLFAHFVYAWPWPQAQIAGISLSTTSVAVVYAVMIETGFNKTEIGKIILGACFVNDLGTVLALGLVFANYN